MTLARLSMYSARRSSALSSVPEASAASTALTYNSGNMPGCALRALAKEAPPAMASFTLISACPKGEAPSSTASTSRPSYSAVPDDVSVESLLVTAARDAVDTEAPKKRRAPANGALVPGREIALG